MKSTYTTIKISLFINYFIFAMLLNSVGIVILQVQNNFNVSASDAAILEGFKDLSIALFSFFVATFLVRFGYKRSMMLALALVTIVCFVMPMLPYFFMTKALFAVTGVSFALMKGSIFSTLGLITEDKKQHASLMSFLESFFMVGIVLGAFAFSFFVTEEPSNQWLNTYYFISALGAGAMVLLFFAKFDEESVLNEKGNNNTDESFHQLKVMLKLVSNVLVLVFILSAFLYVLLEQGLMSWLPSFNNKVLNLSSQLSIQMGSILAASTALGRFLSGFFLRKMDWYYLIVICLAGSLILVAGVMPMIGEPNGAVINSWFDAPLAAFLFPMIGLLLAPIYPAINSTILSALPINVHAFMSGLIIIFSALGGTVGSIITGNVFEFFGGKTAFYLSIIPIVLLFVTLSLFKYQLKTLNK